MSFTVLKGLQVPGTTRARKKHGGYQPPPPPIDPKIYGSVCVYVEVPIVDKNNLCPIGKVIGQYNDRDDIVKEVESACHDNMRGRPWRCLKPIVTFTQTKPCLFLVKFEIADKIK